jgi:uncharacterized damage-inducible protein DinB
MNWKELINGAIEYNYGVTQSLMDKVSDGELDWKPSTGQNWLNVGQLLRHIADASGSGFKGFATGDWGMPEGMDLSEMSPEDMLPPAEKFQGVSSVAEAKKLLDEDKRLALDTLAGIPEADLDGKIISAPWEERPAPLGLWLLRSVWHLTQHKGQLFYYLKLMGKPVNTHDLWG